MEWCVLVTSYGAFTTFAKSWYYSTAPSDEQQRLALWGKELPSFLPRDLDVSPNVWRGAAERRM